MGVRQIREGTTRDISMRGVFVYCSSPPPVSTVLRLEIFVPVLNVTAPGQSRLRAEAQVIAVRETESRPGFAAVSDFSSRLEALRMA